MAGKQVVVVVGERLIKVLAGCSHVWISHLSSKLFELGERADDSRVLPPRVGGDPRKARRPGSFRQLGLKGSLLSKHSFCCFYYSLSSCRTITPQILRSRGGSGPETTFARTVRSVSILKGNSAWRRSETDPRSLMEGDNGSHSAGRLRRFGFDIFGEELFALGSFPQRIFERSIG